MNCGFDFADLSDSGPPLRSGAYAAAGVAGPSSNAPEVPIETPDADTAERPSMTSKPVVPPPATDPPIPLVGGASAPIMLGIVAAAVIILLLIGAVLVSVLGDSDDEPSQSASEGTKSAEPDAEGPTDPPAQPRCWDGSNADSLNDCTDPTGTIGLAWVFPSFVESECTNKSSSGAQPAKWACRVDAPNGGRVTIRYREHNSVQRALSAYTQEYGLDNRSAARSPRDDIERYVWRAPRVDNDGLWTVTSMYAEYPWAVTVKGRSSASVDDAFANVVEFRSPRRMSGQST